MKKLIFILFSFFFASCERIFIETQPKVTPHENFDYMWKVVDENYSFFTFKNIDWNKVYANNELKIKSDMSDEALFNVLADMLFILHDGHVNLSTQFDFSRNWKWYLDYPVNFDYNVIERNYLKDNYRITGALTNTIIDSIGYIYYKSFSAGISNNSLNYVLKRFKNTKGLIFDIRGNGGGFLGNVTLLISRFADKKRPVYLERYKTGKGHDDFSPYHQFSAQPDTSAILYNSKPIVVLTNRQCFSSANDFVMRIANFPNVFIAGDTTGGGGGLPIARELPNGWIVRFSTTQSFTPKGFNVENGIPPDTALVMNKSDLEAGKDTYIEFALNYIKNKNAK